MTLSVRRKKNVKAGRRLVQIFGGGKRGFRKKKEKTILLCRKKGERGEKNYTEVGSLPFLMQERTKTRSGLPSRRGGGKGKTALPAEKRREK